MPSESDVNERVDTAGSAPAFVPLIIEVPNIGSRTHFFV
jgi:hypothetical protein